MLGGILRGRPLAGHEAMLARATPLLFLALAAAACLPPMEGEPLDYDDPAMWLCRPGSEDDACHDDLTATEVRPDGSLAVEPHEPASDPAVDCFYVYPTVDLSPIPGNHTDFTDVEAMRQVAQNQAARFTEVCRVYAPLYRQATIASYLSPLRDGYLDVAYRDVEDAFERYLERDNAGRPFVLIGHSQGATMVSKLLSEQIDSRPELRERLVVAMPIGADLYVGAGETKGGSFQSVPICTDRATPGCVVAFRTYADDDPPSGEPAAPAGQEEICVFPALPGSDAPAPVSRAYLPSEVPPIGFGDSHVPEGVATPFALYRDAYQARCVRADDGRAYLAVRFAPGPGDVRENPHDMGGMRGPQGLHEADVNRAIGDRNDRGGAKSAAFHH